MTSIEIPADRPGARDAALRWIAVAASAVFVFMSLVVARPGSNYRFSFLFLVPKNGMLKTEGVYEFDTQRDMFDNFMGAIVAVSLYAWSRRARGAAPVNVPPPPAAPVAENSDWRGEAPSLQSGR